MQTFSSCRKQNIQFFDKSRKQNNYISAKKAGKGEKKTQFVIIFRRIF
jgi:hypothetical protein